jgi:hypothetical protein
MGCCASEAGIANSNPNAAKTARNPKLDDGRICFLLHVIGLIEPTNLAVSCKLFYSALNLKSLPYLGFPAISQRIDQQGESR